MLTFIDGEPLKARLLLRGSTVFPLNNMQNMAVDSLIKDIKTKIIIIHWDPTITAPPLKVPHQ